MKTISIKPVFFAIIASSLLAGCVEDSDYNIPNTDCIETTLVKTKEVNQIPATAVVSQYLADDVIEAYVTSSDRGGNFYKSISFQTLDGSAGFSVPVDITNTYTNFEPGRKVLIKMKDLYTDSPTSGPIGMRIGALYVDPTDGAASVGRLSFAQYGRVLNRSCTVVNEDDLVKHLTITQAKSEAYLNRLVEIDDIQFSDEALGKKYYDELNDVGGATNHLLVDKRGNTIIFRTSSFANYSSQTVPNKRGKIRGVLTKYGTDYQLIARDINDVKLTANRLILNTIFYEPFTTNFPNWTKFSVLGSQVWTLDTQYGNPGSCAKMSGFSSGNQNNEDWLISPVINVSASLSIATLAFETASRFTGNALQVYVSTNYSGSGTPVNATWTELTGFNLDFNPDSYIWTASGPMILDNYIGQNVYIAFKYTSTTSGAVTWEVDNVKVTGI